jgi:ubiquinone/menaquinone biosynthesis C-methylase UbiE
MPTGKTEICPHIVQKRQPTAAIWLARALFGERAIALCCADATALPYADASFDAVLDKGTLDAIGIGSDDSLRASVAELARTVATGGVVVSISRAHLKIGRAHV